MKQVNLIVALLKAIYQLLKTYIETHQQAKETSLETLQLLNRKEAAEFLLVDPKTVTNWRKRNILPAASNEGGAPKYRLDDLNRCYEWHWGRPK